ncbi:MAG TPA: TolC family protein, partial [Granulicella sp.]|nr:TolC family protein [Granulicella sp.]
MNPLLPVTPPELISMYDSVPAKSGCPIFATASPSLRWASSASETGFLPSASETGFLPNASETGFFPHTSKTVPQRVPHPRDDFFVAERGSTQARTAFHSLAPLALLLATTTALAQQTPLPHTLPANPPDSPSALTVPRQTIPEPIPTPESRGPVVFPVPAIASFVPSPNTQTGQLVRDENTPTAPRRSEPSSLRPSFLGFLGPYRRARVPELFPGDGTRLLSLIRNNKLYLTLQDAIDLAIENNLDVEVERDNLVLADTDLLRARGGGSTRGIDLTVQETPAGVGAPGSPLLNTTAVSGNPITPAITDLTSLNSTTQIQTNLAETATSLYSPGPTVPLFDPSLFAQSAYLQRSNTVALGTTTTTPTTGDLHYVAANLSYLQGFHTGAQLEATANNDSQVLYGTASQLDPFSTPSTSVTLTQPLLRGRGQVNIRFLRIANLDKKASRLLFEQQLMETIYGISRLYFDLVSLGENVNVQQESLRATLKLESDDTLQVEQGTLAPIELTRVQALASSTNYNLIQAQSLYRQQEVILRNQLLRSSSPVFSASFSEIVPTDQIQVPDHLDPAAVGLSTLDVPTLIQQALSRRPDLAQAGFQVQAGRLNAQASRNQALPQLNVYGNVQTRGASEQAYESLGSPGTGLPTLPQNFALGGLRTSTIYQGGIQLTLPLRNRVAQSDAARDQVQLRQSEARTEKIANQIRVDVENAVIALQTAQAAYIAATTSRG